jgi:signal transduction histidine kinase
LATSSRKRKFAGKLPVADSAALLRYLMAIDPSMPVPLLVVRLRDLERTAWQKGRPAARALERRSLRSFVATASRALRSSDILAHDDESQDFLAALVSPTRSTGSVATPTDCRATLARLASAMKLGGGMQIETGWTILYGSSDQRDLVSAVESALERGSRERERYAFFATIGHEIRTPLTSILGYLETLIEQELDAATTRRFLEVARGEAVRLERLVDGMFEISMLDLRAGVQRGESCLLSVALAAALNAVAPFAAARRSSTLEMPYDDCQVAVASDRLVQILVNILENAIKHGRDDGCVTLSVATLDARYIEIRIDDDGPGVEADERESRLLLERVGGEVDVTSSDLGGARFCVRVPVFDGSDHATGPQPAALSR